MNDAITINTRFNTDEIRQELRGSDDIRGNVHEYIMQLRDQGVREALKKLGWTPPGEEPEWDGETWPPPINTACEYRDAENSEWCQGVCVGYYNNYAVVVDEGDGGVSVQIVEHVRPLRTAEQREEEALAQRISDFYKSKTPEEYLCLARELIRDGYRKEIEI